MAAQDVIRLLLFLLNLQNRKHKQAILAPAVPNSPRTLSKQLYYGSTRVMYLLFLLNLQNREHKQVILAPTGPCTRLSKQSYYGSTRCNSPSSVPSQLTKSWTQPSDTSSYWSLHSSVQAALLWQHKMWFAFFCSFSTYKIVNTNKWY